MKSVLLKTASRLLQKYGTPVKIQRRAETSYNPQTGDHVSIFAEVETRGVLESFRAHMVDGTTIKAGDLKLTLASADFLEGQPSPGDHAVVEGKVFSVMHVEVIHLQDQNILYVLQVRK